MRVAIDHETVYRYRAPTNYSIQYLRLSPMSDATQQVISWKLSSDGNLKPWIDGFGNQAHVLVMEGPHHEVRIKAIGEVEINDMGKPLLAETEPHPPELFLRSTRLTEPDERVRRFAGGFKPAVMANRRKGLDSLIAGIRQTVTASDAEPAISAGRVLEDRAGGAEAQSHLFVACCRSLGVPARYISGYLCSDGDNGLASHAWSEAWIDGAGWLTYDVANRMSNAKAHVRVAVGFDSLDTAPVRAIRQGGGNEPIEIETVLSKAQKPKPSRDLHQQQQQQ